MDVKEINEVIEKSIKDNVLLIETVKENNKSIQKIVSSYGKKRIAEIKTRSYAKHSTKCKSQPFDKIDTLFLIIFCLATQKNKFNLKSDKPMYLDLTLLRELKTLELMSDDNFFEKEFLSVNEYEQREEEYILKGLTLTACDTNTKRVINKLITMNYPKVSVNQFRKISALFGTYINKTEDKEINVADIMTADEEGGCLILKDGNREFRTSLSYLSSAKTIIADRLKYLNNIDFLKFYVKTETGEFKEISFTELKYQKDTYIRFN